MKDPLGKWTSAPSPKIRKSPSVFETILYLGCGLNFRKKGCKIAGRSEGGRNETRRIAAKVERDERRDPGGGSAMAGGTSTGDDERDRG